MFSNLRSVCGKNWENKNEMLQPRRGWTLGELAWATVIILGLGFVVVGLLMPVQRMTPRGTARRSQCQNNIKQIALALLNYHSTNHRFPPAYTVDSEGKPLHSWRTLLLPYLEQAELYQKIDLTKPWDDPANADVRNTVLEVFRCPSYDGPPTQTTYLAVVTPNSCLRPGASCKISEITDGTSNTLAIIEVDVAHAVHWMSPSDADESLFLSLGSKSQLSHIGIFHGLFLDGRVRDLNLPLTIELRRALITVDGKEPIGDF